jgi:membrane protease YdiL (CAAX protease family)
MIRRTALAVLQPILQLKQWWPARLVIYLGALLLIASLTKLVTNPFIPANSSPMHEVLATIRNVMQAIAMIAAYSLLVKRIEGRQPSEIGPAHAAKLLLGGAFTGSFMVALIYAILLGMGVAHFQSGTGFEGIAIGVLKPSVIGTLEELLFRVILFRILEHIGGTLAAVLVSASLFGLAHAGNPGATPLTMAFLAIELGVFLALVYVMIRSLWMIAAIHMSWNFTQGFIFGSDVSGLDSSNSILLTTLDGPDLLTGGTFGLEGSIVALGVCLIPIAALSFHISRRALWHPVKLEFRARNGMAEPLVRP